MNVQTNNAIELTSEQLFDLFSKVYGILDSNGIIFLTSEYDRPYKQEGIRLFGQGEYIDIFIEGASVEDSTLNLLRHDEVTEQFTLLGTVNCLDLDIV